MFLKVSECSQRTCNLKDDEYILISKAKSDTHRIMAGYFVTDWQKMQCLRLF